jgi:hypothetical protein
LITPLTVIGAEVNRNLSGTWILNIQLSDDFQEKIKEHVKSARNNRENRMVIQVLPGREIVKETQMAIQELLGKGIAEARKAWQ